MVGEGIGRIHNYGVILGGGGVAVVEIARNVYNFLINVELAA